MNINTAAGSVFINSKDTLKGNEFQKTSFNSSYEKPPVIKQMPFQNTNQINLNVNTGRSFEQDSKDVLSNTNTN